MTQDNNTVYTHPTSKQCNYSPDLSGYATVSSVNDLKSSVSNGKNLIANAITGKGVATSSSDAFATMASNINSISSTITMVHGQSYTMNSGTYVDVYNMTGINYAVIIYSIYRSRSFYACSSYYYANGTITLIDCTASNQNNVLPVIVENGILKCSQGHTSGTSGPQYLQIYA